MHILPANKILKNSKNISVTYFSFPGPHCFPDAAVSLCPCRYKPPSTENNPALEDPTPDYMNLLGMIFSMCGLMLKVGLTPALTASYREGGWQDSLCTAA